MRTPTVKDAPRMVRALKPHVDNLLAAIAIAQIERPKANAIQKRLLAEANYYGRMHDGKQFRVTDLSDTFRMDEFSAKHYYARLDAAYRAAGYDLPEGHCPALVAEHTQTQAEWALIEAAQEFFPDIDNNGLLCGTKDMGGIETRQKYIDLLVGLVVNAPGGYRHPMHANA